MHKLTFVGAKGGVGTTTVACGVALQAEATSYHVTLVGDQHDICTVLGAVANDSGYPKWLRDQLVVVSPDHLDGYLGYNAPARTLIIHDAGTLATYDGPAHVLVTRNCYLALKRSMGAHLRGIQRVFMLSEAGRALSDLDAAEVLGLPVSSMDTSPELARSIDAGLLMSRVPRQYASSMRRLLTDVAGVAAEVRAPLVKA